MMRFLPLFVVFFCFRAHAQTPEAPTAAPTATAPAALPVPTPTTQQELAQFIHARVQSAGLGNGIGVSVVDLSNGQEIAAVESNVARNPASDTKLITAAVALFSLGADHRFVTTLAGRIEGDAVVGGLYLRGRGDPTLRRADLIELAEQLAERGVRRVDEVVIDASYFDTRVLPPAFEQQPNEIAPFRASVAAVSVDENAYVLHVDPATAVDQPAIIRLDAATHFDVHNEVRTVASGAPRIIAEQQMRNGQLSLTIRGAIALGSPAVEVRRRIEDPIRFAGHALVEALRRLDIRVPARVRIANTPEDAGVLATHRSAALATILFALGKDSDNFVAEMVLKTVAAERRRPGTTEAGCAEAVALLERAGVTRGAATMINGSGLFTGNLIAPAHFTHLLAHVYRNPGIYAEYLAQLSVGGQDGTLSQRLRDVPRGVVRAKTGTLNDVVALGGYVLGPPGRAPIAFSILANGVAGHQGDARNMADDIVRAIANYLHH